MILELLFPRKCILCRKILQSQETDLCHQCRETAPVFSRAKNNIPFVARWTAVWYYKDNVRLSLVRYKFRNAQGYSDAYGRLLAMKVLSENMSFDYITWVPISFRRKFKRGYNQVQLLAKAAAKELQCPVLPTLKKIRHNPPQSGIQESSARKANVLGVYRVTDPSRIAGKRILLIDDVITTGATCSECARMLLLAGAEEVYCCAVASAFNDKKK